MDFGIGTGLLGSLFGGLFRIAPEILKWLDRKDERAHELAMFQLQTDLEKQRGTFTMEAKYADHSIAALDAIKSAFEDQQVAVSRASTWVASASAFVRPGITYVLFGMYCLVKLVTLVYALMHGADWGKVLTESYDAEDFAMLNLVITFWFVGRAIERYQK